MPSLESQELASLPPALRALLDTELSAGNRIVGVEHGFPAPPTGFCVWLEQAITTRPADADDGLRFSEWPNWKGCGGYTDAQGRHVVLNPPISSSSAYPEMSWDEHGACIRSSPTPAIPPETRDASRGDHDDALLRRFWKSMEIDYEKWHDGIGYDLDALRAMSDSQRGVIETELLARGIRDWRDVEAFALLDSPAARFSLLAALDGADAEIRLAVATKAPDLVSPDKRAASLVAALETATFGNGLSDAIDAVVDFHPPLVMDALWRGARVREGGVAVYFAALLAYLHGLAAEPFDLAGRSFILAFNTDNALERAAAIEMLHREICPDAGDR